VHQAGLADFAADNGLADTGEVGVEAPVESDLELDSCSLDRSESSVDFLQVEGDGLLAEDVFTGCRGLHDEISVRVGGGADQHSVDFWVGEDLCAGGGNGGNVAVGSQGLRSLSIDVGNGDYHGFRHAESQRFSMDAPDASSAYDSEMKLFHVQCALTIKSSNTIGSESVFQEHFLAHCSFEISKPELAKDY
jgi:hypothetical protein